MLFLPAGEIFLTIESIVVTDNIAIKSEGLAAFSDHEWIDFRQVEISGFKHLYSLLAMSANFTNALPLSSSFSAIIQAEKRKVWNGMGTVITLLTIQFRFRLRRSR